MRRALRDSGLSLAFLVLFLVTIVAQSFAGLAETNEELAEHGHAALDWVQYVTSSDFVVDVAENWQSEFLQFFLFILATIWLVQKGSPESNPPGDEGPGPDSEQRTGAYAYADSPRWSRAGGWRQRLYSNSLLIAMGAFFLLSWLAQSLAGVVVANEDRADHGEAPLDWLQYVGSPDFWSRTLQNWQSEFLAIGVMVAFAIYLRQRGSSQSKPVGAPHYRSGEES